jgi:ABC-type uncharacterized transport system ATPase subunit
VVLHGACLVDGGAQRVAVIVEPAPRQDLPAAHGRLPVHRARALLHDLAAQGKTVFVSSHLMSEIAQTATHLIVIGRGELIADTGVAEFIASAAPPAVRVRSSDQRTLAGLLRSPDVTVTTVDGGVCAG